MKTFKLTFSTLLISALILSGCSSTSSATPAEILTLKANDRITGPANAPVTIIEYADFQCPICAAYHPLTDQLTAEFPDKLQFVYRYFPLVGTHQNAMPSAKAAEAAGLQGKFWEMSDLLFEHQKDWAEVGDPKSIFVSYAQQLQLNNDQFLKDYDSKEVQDRIKKDYDDAMTLNLEGTPTFFLNGKQFQISGDQFKAYVESVVKSTPDNAGNGSQTQASQQ